MTNPPTPGPVAQQFGTISRLSPAGHKGQDRGNPMRTHIKNMKKGTVVAVDRHDDVYGKCVTIKHAKSLTGKTVESFYGHCDEIVVEVGDVLNAGELVAYSGRSGIATGPHTHVGLKIGGVWVNPTRWYGKK